MVGSLASSLFRADMLVISLDIKRPSRPKHQCLDVHFGRLIICPFGLPMSRLRGHVAYDVHPLPFTRLLILDGFEEQLNIDQCADIGILKEILL